MKKYLLDTNICVFILRGKFNIHKKIAEVGIENCYISQITQAELLYGAECSNRPIEITKTISEFCKRIEVIPIGNSIPEFARQKAILRKGGMLIDDFDLLIASCAIANDFIMVTDNLKHLGRIGGIKLENWINR